MENIRYGRLEARDEECIAAAHRANADAFISRLPDGAINTMLTGDGANFSQGQRQLIAIARAAVADPPVIILDEATSSIDTRTEMLVQQPGMDGLMYGRTAFVIAHRLSTVRNANCIMVLEQGRIIEQGHPRRAHREEGQVLPALHRQSASVRRLSHRSSIPVLWGRGSSPLWGEGYFHNAEATENPVLPSRAHFSPAGI